MSEESRARDEAMMRRAIVRAAQAFGRTAPNPPVGAVLVRADTVIGEGYTQPAGQDHAEIVALKDCRRRGEDPRGATLFVTLEPCCHHGRTPPCTSALLEAGVSRVVIGVLDPFAPMRGRSAALLRERGVAVEVGLLRAEASRLVLGFARAVVFGMPEVTLKAAITADGHIATSAGQSKWITSETAREQGHRLRSAHDAVMVGINTALLDDPALTTRTPEHERPHHAVPVVVDTELRLPATARLLSSPARALVLAATDARSRDLPAEIVRIPRDPSGGLDLRAALAALASRGLHRVLVEGGGILHRSLLEARLADTIELFIAPKILPGGRPFVGGPPAQSLSDAIGMRLRAVEVLGPDLRATYDLEHALPDPLADLA